MDGCHFPHQLNLFFSGSVIGQIELISCIQIFDDKLSLPVYIKGQLSEKEIENVLLGCHGDLSSEKTICHMGWYYTVCWLKPSSHSSGYQRLESCLVGSFAVIGYMTECQFLMMSQSSGCKVGLNLDLTTSHKDNIICIVKSKHTCIPGLGTDDRHDLMQQQKMLSCFNRKPSDSVYLTADMLRSSFNHQRRTLVSEKLKRIKQPASEIDGQSSTIDKDRVISNKGDFTKSPVRKRHKSDPTILDSSSVYSEVSDSYNTSDKNEKPVHHKDRKKISTFSLDHISSKTSKGLSKDRKESRKKDGHESKTSKHHKEASKKDEHKKSGKTSLLSKLEDAFSCGKRKDKEKKESKPKTEKSHHKSSSKSKHSNKASNINDLHNSEQVFSGMLSYSGLTKQLGRIPKKVKSENEVINATSGDNVIQIDSLTDVSSKKGDNRKDGVVNKEDTGVLTERGDGGLELLENINNGFDVKSLVGSTLGGSDKLLSPCSKSMSRKLGKVDLLQDMKKSLEPLLRNVCVTENDLRISIKRNKFSLQKVQLQEKTDITDIFKLGIFGPDVIEAMQAECKTLYDCVLSIHETTSIAWNKSVIKMGDQMYKVTLSKTERKVEPIISVLMSGRKGSKLEEVEAGKCVVPKSSDLLLKPFNNVLMIPSPKPLDDSSDDDHGDSLGPFGDSGFRDHSHLDFGGSGLDKSPSSLDKGQHDHTKGQADVESKANTADKKSITNIKGDKPEMTMDNALPESNSTFKIPKREVTSIVDNNIKTKQTVTTTLTSAEHLKKEIVSESVNKIVTEKSTVVDSQTSDTSSLSSNKNVDTSVDESKMAVTNKSSSSGQTEYRTVTLSSGSQSKLKSPEINNIDNRSRKSSSENSTSQANRDSSESGSTSRSRRDSSRGKSRQGSSRDKSRRDSSQDKSRPDSSQDKSTRDSSRDRSRQDSSRDKSRRDSSRDRSSSKSRTHDSRDRSSSRSRSSNSSTKVEKLQDSSKRSLSSKKSPDKRQGRSPQKQDSKNVSPRKLETNGSEPDKKSATDSSAKKKDIAEVLKNMASTSGEIDVDKKTQRADKRKIRQYHPYKKKKHDEHLPHWSFDLAYCDLNELLQNLTENAYKQLGHTPVKTFNQGQSRNFSRRGQRRFQNFKFRRSAVYRTPPREESSSEDEIDLREIPELERRARQADLIEERILGTEKNEGEFGKEMQVYEKDTKETIDKKTKKTSPLVVPGASSTFSKVDLKEGSKGDELAFGKRYELLEKPETKEFYTYSVKLLKGALSSIRKHTSPPEKSVKNVLPRKNETSEKMDKGSKTSASSRRSDPQKKDDEKSSNGSKKVTKDVKQSEKVVKVKIEFTDDADKEKNETTNKITESVVHKDDNAEQNVLPSEKKLGKKILSSESEECLDWSDKDETLDKHEDDMIESSDDISSKTKCFVVVDSLVESEIGDMTHNSSLHTDDNGGHKAVSDGVSDPSDVDESKHITDGCTGGKIADPKKETQTDKLKDVNETVTNRSDKNSVGDTAIGNLKSILDTKEEGKDLGRSSDKSSNDVSTDIPGKNATSSGDNNPLKGKQSNLGDNSSCTREYVQKTDIKVTGKDKLDVNKPPTENKDENDNIDNFEVIDMNISGNNGIQVDTNVIMENSSKIGKTNDAIAKEKSASDSKNNNCITQKIKERKAESMKNDPDVKHGRNCTSTRMCDKRPTSDQKRSSRWHNNAVSNVDDEQNKPSPVYSSPSVYRASLMNPSGSNLPMTQNYRHSMPMLNSQANVPSVSTRYPLNQRGAYNPMPRQFLPGYNWNNSLAHSFSRMMNLLNPATWIYNRQAPQNMNYNMGFNNMTPHQVAALALGRLGLTQPNSAMSAAPWIMSPENMTPFMRGRNPNTFYVTEIQRSSNSPMSTYGGPLKKTYDRELSMSKPDKDKCTNVQVVNGSTLGSSNTDNVKTDDNKHFDGPEMKRRNEVDGESTSKPTVASTVSSQPALSTDYSDGSQVSTECDNKKDSLIDGTDKANATLVQKLGSQSLSSASPLGNDVNSLKTLCRKALKNNVGLASSSKSDGETLINKQLLGDNQMDLVSHTNSDDKLMRKNELPLKTSDCSGTCIGQEHTNDADGLKGQLKLFYASLKELEEADIEVTEDIIVGRIDTGTDCDEADRSNNTRHDIELKSGDDQTERDIALHENEADFQTGQENAVQQSKNINKEVFSTECNKEGCSLKQCNLPSKTIEDSYTSNDIKRIPPNDSKVPVEKVTIDTSCLDIGIEDGNEYREMKEPTDSMKNLYALINEENCVDSGIDSEKETISDSLSVLDKKWFIGPQLQVDLSKDSEQASTNVEDVKPNCAVLEKNHFIGLQLEVDVIKKSDNISINKRGDELSHAGDERSFIGPETEEDKTKVSGRTSTNTTDVEPGCAALDKKYFIGPQLEVDQTMDLEKASTNVKDFKPKFAVEKNHFIGPQLEEDITKVTGKISTNNRDVEPGNAVLDGKHFIGPQLETDLTQLTDNASVSIRDHNCIIKFNYDNQVTDKTELNDEDHVKTLVITSKMPDTNSKSMEKSAEFGELEPGLSKTTGVNEEITCTVAVTDKEAKYEFSNDIDEQLQLFYASIQNEIIDNNDGKLPNDSGKCVSPDPECIDTDNQTEITDMLAGKQNPEQEVKNLSLANKDITHTATETDKKENINTLNNDMDEELELFHASIEEDHINDNDGKLPHDTKCIDTDNHSDIMNIQPAEQKSDQAMNNPSPMVNEEVKCAAMNTDTEENSVVLNNDMNEQKKLFHASIEEDCIDNDDDIVTYGCVPKDSPCIDTDTQLENMNHKTVLSNEGEKNTDVDVVEKGLSKPIKSDESLLEVVSDDATKSSCFDYDHTVNTFDTKNIKCELPANNNEESTETSYAGVSTSVTLALESIKSEMVEENEESMFIPPNVSKSMQCDTLQSISYTSIESVPSCCILKSEAVIDDSRSNIDEFTDVKEDCTDSNNNVCENGEAKSIVSDGSKLSELIMARIRYNTDHNESHSSNASDLYGPMNNVPESDVNDNLTGIQKENPNDCKDRENKVIVSLTAYSSSSEDEDDERKEGNSPRDVIDETPRVGIDDLMKCKWTSFDEDTTNNAVTGDDFVQTDMNIVNVESEDYPAKVEPDIDDEEMDRLYKQAYADSPKHKRRHWRKSNEDSTPSKKNDTVDYRDFSPGVPTLKDNYFRSRGVIRNTVTSPEPVRHEECRRVVSICTDKPLKVAANKSSLKQQQHNVYHNDNDRVHGDDRKMEYNLLKKAIDSKVLTKAASIKSEYSYSYSEFSKQNASQENKDVYVTQWLHKHTLAGHVDHSANNTFKTTGTVSSSWASIPSDKMSILSAPSSYQGQEHSEDNYSDVYPSSQSREDCVVKSSGLPLGSSAHGHRNRKKSPEVLSTYGQEKECNISKNDRSRYDERQRKSGNSRRNRVYRKYQSPSVSSRSRSRSPNLSKPARYIPCQRSWSPYESEDSLDRYHRPSHVSSKGKPSFNSKSPPNVKSPCSILSPVLSSLGRSCDDRSYQRSRRDKCSSKEHDYISTNQRTVTITSKNRNALTRDGPESLRKNKSAMKLPADKFTPLKYRPSKRRQYRQRHHSTDSSDHARVYSPSRHRDYRDEDDDTRSRERDSDSRCRVESSMKSLEKRTPRLKKRVVLVTSVLTTIKMSDLVDIVQRLVKSSSTCCQWILTLLSSQLKYLNGCYRTIIEQLDHDHSCLQIIHSVENLDSYVAMETQNTNVKEIHIITESYTQDETTSSIVNYCTLDVLFDKYLK
ncbi:hypothetical protein ACF0H5_014138 [Mactra antiquata]